MTVSLTFAAFSTKLWHFFLTQGVLCGVGAGSVYFPPSPCRRNGPRSGVD